MSDKKISQLNDLETSADTDLIPVVDVVAIETKRQTKANFLKEVTDELGNKIETETDPIFTASEAANFAAGDKSKLDGIENNANNYTLENHDNEAHDENYITGISGGDVTTALGYTPENQANKTSSFQSTPDNTKYPTEKLVKDSLDTKQATLVSGTTIKTVNSTSLLGSGDIVTPNTTYTAGDGLALTGTVFSNTDRGSAVDLTPFERTDNKAQNNGYASLDSGGKVPASQLPATTMHYLGSWNANTNTPTLVDGTGTAGDIYLTSVAGTQNLGSGNIDFADGDWVVYSGTVWEKSINSNKVISVNEQTGVVTLTTDHIDEGLTKKYDKTVSLTAGDYISITGTYPDFTIAVTTISATAISNEPAGNIEATTVQAAINELDTEKQASLGYTAENADNKMTSFQATPTDTAYPSEKLVKDSLNDKADIADLSKVEINAQTDNYTLVLADAGKLITVTSGTAKTLTIPKNDTVDFAIGTKIAIIQGGAGTVTIAGATDVVIKSFEDAYDLAGEDAGCLIIKTGENEWRLEGNLVV